MKGWLWSLVVGLLVGVPSFGAQEAAPPKEEEKPAAKEAPKAPALGEGLMERIRDLQARIAARQAELRAMVFRPDAPREKVRALGADLAELRWELHQLFRQAALEGLPVGRPGMGLGLGLGGPPWARGRRGVGPPGFRCGCCLGLGVPPGPPPAGGRGFGPPPAPPGPPGGAGFAPSPGPPPPGPPRGAGSWGPPAGLPPMGPGGEAPPPPGR